METKHDGIFFTMCISDLEYNLVKILRLKNYLKFHKKCEVYQSDNEELSSVS